MFQFASILAPALYVRLLSMFSLSANDWMHLRFVWSDYQDGDRSSGCTNSTHNIFVQCPTECLSKSVGNIQTLKGIFNQVIRFLHRSQTINASSGVLLLSVYGRQIIQTSTRLTNTLISSLGLTVD